jgi:hypothetical protein
MRSRSFRSDDAPGAPNLRDLSHVDVPAALLAGRSDLVKALGVRDDLARPKSVADVVDDLLPRCGITNIDHAAVRPLERGLRVLPQLSMR